MNKIFNTWYSVLRLGAILVVAAVASGCISAKSTAVTAAQPASVGTSSYGGPLVTRWVVTVGNNLWGIAGHPEVYNMSEKWPLIYKSNIAKIKDADLLHPGQVLNIPRDSSRSEIAAAIRHAKRRDAWSVGPVEITDKEYLSTP